MRSENFKKMVEKSPDNQLFRFSLGQSLFDEGSHAEAVEHLDACCKIKEDWMMPRILLGKSYLQLGQIDQARSVLETALALAIAQEHEAPEAELRALLDDIR
jgi:Flp pilus assembly protein TadD